jgi:hypothetical protein
VHKNSAAVRLRGRCCLFAGLLHFVDPGQEQIHPFQVAIEVEVRELSKDPL